MAANSNNNVKIGAGIGVVVALILGWFFLTGPETPAPAAPEPVAAAPAPEPAPAPAPAPEPALPVIPSLDVVRVSPEGDVTVAGRAEGGAAISLRIDGAEFAAATADSAGAYASLFTLPPSDAPRVLTLAAVAPDGTEVMGTDSVVIAPFALPEAVEPETALADAAPSDAADAPVAAAPDALKLGDQGVQVLSSAALANVTIDTITYEGDGVRVGGRGAAGGIVRLYLNNADSASANIGADGSFDAQIISVQPGAYTLRADQLDDSGAVTSRYEISFTKAAPEALAEAAPAPTVVEVTAGTTLWAIAQANFGDGLMYVQVYEANKDLIRDPDLIYPGQVFTIPAMQ